MSNRICRRWKIFAMWYVFFYIAQHCEIGISLRLKRIGWFTICMRFIYEIVISSWTDISSLVVLKSNALSSRQNFDKSIEFDPTSSNTLSCMYIVVYVQRHRLLYYLFERQAARQASFRVYSRRKTRVFLKIGVSTRRWRRRRPLHGSASL